MIPTVTQCGEAEANAGTCPGASKIGVVGVEAGAGPTPYGFAGNVYLTGPYNGAPFGLSIVVAATAGPFNLGNVVTRGTLTVNPYTARVTATSAIPTIYKGIPLRLKHISVNINKQGFLINPTNCGVLATESTLSGIIAPGAGVDCHPEPVEPVPGQRLRGAAFKPSFKAKTSAKTSKANGASLETTLNIGAGQTNFKSVMVQLPKQLPSRLTTLQKACPEAVFNANPYKCPSGSFVGGARANTPTLPRQTAGAGDPRLPRWAAFPDLDLVMEANGVRVILVGNTKISKGITTTTFASPPDVPVSSITVNLPIGGHSALTANGNLCINPLTMPTTMIGQNGFKVTQKTKHHGRRLPGADRREEDGWKHGVHNRADLLGRAHQRQRVEPQNGLPQTEQGRENGHAQGPALERGPAPGQAAEGQAAGRLRAQDERASATPRRPRRWSSGSAFVVPWLRLDD